MSTSPLACRLAFKIVRGLEVKLDEIEMSAYEAQRLSFLYKEKKIMRYKISHVITCDLI